jgi:hypothetical protein
MTLRVRGHRNPPPSYPTPEGMRLLEASLATEKSKVAGHLETIKALEARVAELEAERDCKAVPAPANIDAARARCAVVSERISRGLEERDGLLDYILSGSPPVENRVRLSGPPYADGGVTTRRSVVRKLRIGEKTNPLFCPTCGQSMPGFSSAHLFMGFYDEKDGGGLGELFISLGRSQRSSLAGGGFHFAAKMASLALQHGAPAASLIRQMRRDRDNSEGRPYGPDGPIPGPRVTSMTDLVGLTIERILAERAPKVVAVATEPPPNVPTETP